jgi:hypothetical protein
LHPPKARYPPGLFSSRLRLSAQPTWNACPPEPESSRRPHVRPPMTFSDGGVHAHPTVGLRRLPAGRPGISRSHGCLTTTGFRGLSSPSRGHARLAP